MEKKEKELSKYEQLKKEVEEDINKRQTEASILIEKILKEKNCHLEVELIWREGQNPLFNKLIVANPTK